MNCLADNVHNVFYFYFLAIYQSLSIYKRPHAPKCSPLKQKYHLRTIF